MNAEQKMVQIGRLQIGSGQPLALVAGPCVLEDEDLVYRTAEQTLKLGAANGFPLVFKASFDKANRTRGDAPRGPGLFEGLRILEGVRRRFGVPVLTDVHETSQCSMVAEVVDVLQIPAFLCRQTDLLYAAGATGLPVNIKKGQFMAAEDMGFAVAKTVDGRSADQPQNVLVTERGTFFGYRDLVVDFRNLGILRTVAPVVFDGTHAVQRPGAGGGVTTGLRSQVPDLVRAAVACGVDALFLEVHPDPDNARSDGSTSLDLNRLGPVLESARRIRDACE